MYVYTIIWYGVDLHNYWIRNLAWLAENVIIKLCNQKSSYGIWLELNEINPIFEYYHTTHVWLYWWAWFNVQWFNLVVSRHAVMLVEIAYCHSEIE